MRGRPADILLHALCEAKSHHVFFFFTHIGLPFARPHSLLLNLLLPCVTAQMRRLTFPNICIQMTCGRAAFCNIVVCFITSQAEHAALKRKYRIMPHAPWTTTAGICVLNIPYWRVSSLSLSRLLSRRVSDSQRLFVWPNSTWRLVSLLQAALNLHTCQPERALGMEGALVYCQVVFQAFAVLPCHCSLQRCVVQL